MHAVNGMSKCPRHLKKPFGYSESRRVFAETCTSDSKQGGHIIARTKFHVVASM